MQKVNETPKLGMLQLKREQISWVLKEKSENEVLRVLVNLK